MLSCITCRLRLKMNGALNTRHGSKKHLRSLRLLPSLPVCQEADELNFDYDDIYQNVKKIVKDLGIPLIDPHEEFLAKEKNPLSFYPFELYGHFNIDGYRRSAETIHKLTNN